MVTQFGIKFAVHLITNHFGNLVAVILSLSRLSDLFCIGIDIEGLCVQKVCENLFSHGSLTLDQLVRYSELTKDQVKNSLLVLVQHNCCQAFISAPEDDGIITLLFCLIPLLCFFFASF